MRVETRKVIIKEEVYIAEDGTEFDDKEECETHELLKKGEELLMIDYRGYDTDNLDDCWAVNLRSLSEVKTFVDLCKYSDISSKGVDGTGMYIYTEGTYGGRNNAWTNISQIVKDLNGGNDD